MATWSLAVNTFGSDVAYFKPIVYNSAVILPVNGTNHFLSWDGTGTDWTSVPYTPAIQIYYLAVLGSDLYAIASNNYMYRWNGSNAWTQITTSLPPFGAIQDFYSFGGELFIGTGGGSGGMFAPGGDILKWDGSTGWIVLYSSDHSIGAPGTSFSGFAEHNGELYIGSTYVADSGPPDPMPWFTRLYKYNYPSSFSVVFTAASGEGGYFPKHVSWNGDLYRHLIHVFPDWTEEYEIQKFDLIAHTTSLAAVTDPLPYGFYSGDAVVFNSNFYFVKRRDGALVQFDGSSTLIPIIDPPGFGLNQLLVFNGNLYATRRDDNYNTSLYLGISASVIADFSATPISGTVNLFVQFTDASTGATSWSWDFGDGNSSTDPNPSHFYNISGTYTVTLTINGGSASITKPGYITVFARTFYRYWVSPSTDNWNTYNWAYTSGGPIWDSDASAFVSIPGPENVAVFDTSSFGSCLTDSIVNIGGLILQSDFSNTLTQGPYPIYIGRYDASFMGGNFTGSTEDIVDEGSFYLTGTIFKSTRGTLSVRNSFYHTDSKNPAMDIIQIDEYTISSIDLTNKYIALDNPVSDVAVDIEGGSAQVEGDDFYIDGSYLRWDGMALESKLSAGDILKVTYTARLIASNFYHRNGKVKIKSTNNWFFGGGIRLYDFEFVKALPGTPTTTIDSSCYVANYLYLTGGVLTEGTDGTIFVTGDMTCSKDFGNLSPANNALIDMTSDREQVIYWDNGGIFPTITVDKPGSNEIYAMGPGHEMRVNGNFILQDGTFNLNDHDIRVGL